jgi:hypothetical protein
MRFVSRAMLLALLGCASVPKLGPPPKAADLCPESTALDCEGDPDCSFDADRGCMACECGPGSASRQ